MKIVSYALLLFDDKSKKYEVIRLYKTLYGAKRSPFLFIGMRFAISPVYDNHMAPIKYLMNPFNLKWNRLY